PDREAAARTFAGLEPRRPSVVARWEDGRGHLVHARESATAARAGRRPRFDPTYDGGWRTLSRLVLAGRRVAHLHASPRQPERPARHASERDHDQRHRLD